MDRLVSWFLEKVVPFVSGIAIGVFVAEIFSIVILGLWNVIKWLI